MKVNNVTLGGLMVALTTIILYTTSMIPINTVTILTIASAIIPVVIIRSDIKTAFFVYIASSLIAFFIVPINISLLYSLFFGIYGIIKFFAEKKRSIYIEIIYKFTTFNLSFFLGYFILEKIVGINIISGLGGIIGKYLENTSEYLAFLILWFLAQVVFYIYDYALTMIITFYLDRFKNI